MAHQYCSQHGVLYDYAEGCPECNKVPKLVGGIVGGVLGGAIYGTVWAGKKIYDKIKEGKNKDIIEDQEYYQVSSINENKFKNKEVVLQKEIEYTEDVKIGNIATKNFFQILNENNLSEYIEIFISNKLYDINVIETLVEIDLEKIGINIMGDRKKIINIINKVKLELEKLKKLGIEIN